jgi:hypothetical protein
MAIETLRPSGPGSACNLPLEQGCSACPNHYDCVDEQTADDSATKIMTNVADWLTDLYVLPAHSGEGIINKVTVYAVCKSAYEPVQTALKISCYTHSTQYDGSEETVAVEAWTTYSYEWTTNPNTGLAWTWDEIDALEIGVTMRCSGAGNRAQVTQVWVEVDYTVPIEKSSSELGQGSDYLAARIETPTKGGGMKLWT